MKNGLPVKLLSVLITGLMGLTACTTPVEGSIVTIPQGDSIPAYQYPNQIEKTCILPGGQNVLVTRNTYFTEYTGDSTREIKYLSELAALQRGNCNDPGGVFVEDSVINELTTVTDPERQKEITQALCDEDAMGTAEGADLAKQMRNEGFDAPLTDWERFCGPERK